MTKEIVKGQDIFIDGKIYIDVHQYYPHLRHTPEFIEYIKTLQQVEWQGSKDAFRDGAEVIEGKDYIIVENKTINSIYALPLTNGMITNPTPVAVAASMEEGNCDMHGAFRRYDNDRECTLCAECDKPVPYDDAPEKKEQEGKEECIGYLADVDGEKVFVIADNIANCFDKLKAMGYKNYFLMQHSSINVIN